MYNIISFASFVFRFWLCYLTIEAVPIFKSELLGLIIGQVMPVYGAMLLLSYFIVGNIIGYKRGSAPLWGVLLYFIVYVALTLVLWVILQILTAASAIPI
jgi:hypothetical protein